MDYSQEEIVKTDEKEECLKKPINQIEKPKIEKKSDFLTSFQKGAVKVESNPPTKKVENHVKPEEKVIISPIKEEKKIEEVKQSGNSYFEI